MNFTSFLTKQVPIRTKNHLIFKLINLQLEKYIKLKSE